MDLGPHPTGSLAEAGELIAGDSTTPDRNPGPCALIDDRQYFPPYQPLPFMRPPAASPVRPRSTVSRQISKRMRRIILPYGRESLLWCGLPPGQGVDNRPPTNKTARRG